MPNGMPRRTKSPSGPARKGRFTNVGCVVKDALGDALEDLGGDAPDDEGEVVAA
jgi:hypothetical protein